MALVFLSDPTFKHSLLHTGLQKQAFTLVLKRTSLSPPEGLAQISPCLEYSS
jgi:hypothetical protein